jgi:hypothetical protein
VHRRGVENLVGKQSIIGVISDTHGLLRNDAIAALRGSELIIHAGDIGKAEILNELKSLAPVFAVRGNIDTESWAQALPEFEVVEVGGFRVYVLHDIYQLDLKPERAGFAAVIFGHSHRPLIETRAGVLYLNPGSAGPRRFKLPITVARMKVHDSGISAEVVELETGRSILSSAEA